MKYTPILFSTPMVQAILDGRKTMTRRVVKPQPTIDPQTGDWLYKSIDGHEEVHPIEEWKASKAKLCPYGKPGDVLWVRETFQHTKVLNLNHEDENYGFVYKADGQPWNDYEGWKWKPSLFMPKSACRIWLEIISVRVERLQEITEQDAIAEGVEELGGTWYKRYAKEHEYDQNDPYSFFAINATDSFQTLWTMINGPNSWDLNPWVWVIEFKRINK